MNRIRSVHVISDKFVGLDPTLKADEVYEFKTVMEILRRILGEGKGAGPD